MTSLRRVATLLCDKVEYFFELYSVYKEECMTQDRGRVNKPTDSDVLV